MFERFTDRARRVVVLAQEEARQLNHNYVGTEHILIGLIQEGDGVAAQALTALGISLEDARREIERSSAGARNSPRGTSRSPRGPRRCWSFPRVRRGCWGTTTSAPSISCWASFARATASPPRYLCDGVST
jgi:ATP-dependent Clp protease ATP-binding subunit ClpA